jgi:hypothetical protein
MENAISYRSKSADVKIELRVNGSVFPVAQLGPDFLLLDGPAKLPAGGGEIVMRVDANEHRWHVFLPDGLSSQCRTVRIQNR